jgi:predicted  nucleic acid-binding Zn-ribbon protein
MPSDPQLELRVSRLENDRDSIYEILVRLSSVQELHSRRLEAIEVRLDAIEVRLEAIEVRLDAIEARLDRSDGRLGRIETTLVEILRRLPEPA